MCRYELRIHRRCFFFNDTATTEIYTVSLHDALPILSCCEACLYLHGASSAVQSHFDVVVHGRKGMLMMHECKRILNNEVAGTGLWEAQLSTANHEGGGEALQIFGGPEVPADEGAAGDAQESDEERDMEGA